jgi:xanthine/uracil permease
MTLGLPELTALRLPRSRSRRKPSDLAYAATDRPPTGFLLALAGQHTAMAIALAAYALAAAKLGGLSVSATQAFLACTILAMAAATFLQAWGGRLGAGALIVHIPDPLMVPFVALVLRESGAGGMLLLGLAAGLPAIFISRLMPKLRVLFPPAVLGVVVCMGGFALIQGALQHALGLDSAMRPDPVSMLISGVALAAIMMCSIWGTRVMRLYGLVVGIVAGVAVAAAFGRLDGLDLFATTPVIALPTFALPTFDISPALLVVVVVVGLLAQFDTFACVVIMDRMDDADWHRSDMRMIGGGVLANGLGNVLGGMLGGMPNGTSSANIGLAHATRSTSRMIGIAAAAMIALVALLPQATLALSLIPTAVIGAIEIYAAAFLIVSGLELAASRALDARGVYMIGLSLIVGLGIMLMPGLVKDVPEVLRFVVGSGFVMAGLCAMLLNLLFRLGTRMQARVNLDSDPAIARTFVAFIEKQGGIWQVRREVVGRAAHAAMEAAELFAAHGASRQPVAILARFDEFNLDIEIVHTGAPIALAGVETPDVRYLIDADEITTRLAMANVSNVLVQRLADRVRTGTRDGKPSLILHFDH